MMCLQQYVILFWRFWNSLSVLCLEIKCLGLKLAVVTCLRQQPCSLLSGARIMISWKVQIIRTQLKSLVSICFNVDSISMQISYFHLSTEFDFSRKLVVRTAWACKKPCGVDRLSYKIWNSSFSNAFLFCVEAVRYGFSCYF